MLQDDIWTPDVVRIMQLTGYAEQIGMVARILDLSPRVVADYGDVTRRLETTPGDMVNTVPG